MTNKTPISERVATLETHQEHNEGAWAEQIKANTDLYKRTELNATRNTVQETHGKILKWLIGIVIGGAIAMISTLIGSVLLHWLIAGKPGA